MKNEFDRNAGDDDEEEEEEHTGLKICGGVLSVYVK